MHWRILRVILCFPLVVALFGVPTPTMAQSPQGRSPAERAFQEGMSHAEAGSWEEALASFQRSYELDPRPPILINIASAEARLGMLVSARQRYRRFMELAPDHAHVDTAETALEFIEGRLGRLVLEGDFDPEGDQVFVSVDDQGAWIETESYVERTGFLAALEEQLKTAAGKAAANGSTGPLLFIKGDRSTDYGRVRTVMEWINSNDSTVQPEIALVVDLPSSE